MVTAVVCTFAEPEKSAQMDKKRKSNQEIQFAQDTAGRIVSEATRLFAKKGFDGVSIKDISEAADVNIAAVNYHFESKANLFDRIINQFLSELFVSARKILLPPQTPEDLRARLEIFVRQTIEVLVKQPDVIAIIYREAERSNEVLRKTMMKHHEALIVFLEHAKKNRLLAPDVDPFFATQFLMGQIAYQSRKRDGGGRSIFGHSPAAERHRDQWIRQTLRLFLGGVMMK